MITSEAYNALVKQKKQSLGSHSGNNNIGGWAYSAILGRTQVYIDNISSYIESQVKQLYNGADNSIVAKRIREVKKKNIRLFITRNFYNEYIIGEQQNLFERTVQKVTEDILGFGTLFKLLDGAKFKGQEIHKVFVNDYEKIYIQGFGGGIENVRASDIFHSRKQYLQYVDRLLKEDGKSLDSTHSKVEFIIDNKYKITVIPAVMLHTEEPAIIIEKVKLSNVTLEDLEEQGIIPSEFSERYIRQYLKEQSYSALVVGENGGVQNVFGALINVLEKGNNRIVWNVPYTSQVKQNELVSNLNSYLSGVGETVIVSQNLGTDIKINQFYEDILKGTQYITTHVSKTLDTALHDIKSQLLSHLSMPDKILEEFICLAFPLQIEVSNVLGRPKISTLKVRKDDWNQGQKTLEQRYMIFKYDTIFEKLKEEN
ncbi:MULTISPECIES: hypothetical protein [Bacillus]|uniref:Uncharacterized protein n=1 Tax=Bacillus glycinifermentans TaxID=1664069 RepID=A0A0T6BHZ7_9BACI|nr:MULTISPECIES: hypothetical protein [Bacillus]KRT87045.1 hypothetical protein AB447_208750 [Bacillus glycinifermentans]MEC0341901.1 hypothetical protein [Bacillus sonorensis]MEC0457413.1 hypothetical protein [Bacillus sonorensis]MEC0487096.1 hypothetical protein [Bacillus glycinifermentans]MEC0530792.1 hypothetical protein [Bacillus sonorensis]